MVVILAVLAALLFALAGAAEQQAASRLLRAPTASRSAVPGLSGGHAAAARRMRRNLRRGLRLAALLLRSPLWIAGWTADALGFGAQAGALHIGSLSVVQPLLVTTLLFSLPLAGLGTGLRPGWMDWSGGLATSAGLALILSARRVGPTTVVHQARLLLMGLLVVAATAGVVLAARAHPARRAVPLAVAAGMTFALGAALTKLVGGTFANAGVGALLTYWPSYALAAVSLSGLTLQQAAFSAGSLPATMTAMTITDPLLSYGLGVVGFGERGPGGLAAGALSSLGLALLGAGVFVLARSPLLRAARAVATPTAAPGRPAGAPAARPLTALQPPPTAGPPAAACPPPCGTGTA